MLVSEEVAVGFGLFKTSGLMHACDGAMKSSKLLRNTDMMMTFGAFKTFDH